MGARVMDALWLGVSLLFVQPGVSQDRALATETAALVSPQGTVPIERGTFLQVELAQRVDWKHLAHNSRVEGRLTLPVLSGHAIVIPTGTKIELTIESMGTTEE